MNDQLTFYDFDSDALSEEVVKTSVSSITPFITYMGSKLQPRKTILSCYPENTKEIVSPFIGGGSFELLAASSGIKVRGFDKYKSLVRLWNIMLRDAKKVAAAVNEKFPMKPEVLRELVVSRSIHDIEDDIEFASLSICINKQTYNGFFLNHTYYKDSPYSKFIRPGIYDPLNPAKSNKKADRVQNPKYEIKYEKGSLMTAVTWGDWKSPNLSVEVSDWENTLEKYPNSILYADPPYAEEKQSKYYGPYRTHKDKELCDEWHFDHEKFAERLKSHKCGFGLSYLDHPLIRDLYSDYQVIFLQWFQGSLGSQMKFDGHDNKEILILKEPVYHPMSIKYKDVKKEDMKISIQHNRQGLLFEE